MKPKNIFFLAGEKSGDMHAAAVAEVILKENKDLSITAWGGNELKRAGANLKHHYKDMAVMGMDFLGKLWEIKKLIDQCKKDIIAAQTDVLVLVDFSGFNLRIARFAHKAGIKTVYYIAPKTWAWNSSRNSSIRKFIDKLLVILPFEEAYFSQRQIPVSYVGNPSKERIDGFQKSDLRSNLPSEYSKIVALLPGSRSKEIERMSVEMKQLAKAFPDILFVVAAISELDAMHYCKFDVIKNCAVVFDKTYDVLAIADAAVVGSGTATLETALFEVPQVVVYKTSGLTYFVAKNLIKIKYISLVNLLLDQMAVRELVQDDFNQAELRQELKKLLDNKEYAEAMIENYKVLKNNLGEKKASVNTAKEILNVLEL